MTVSRINLSGSHAPATSGEEIEGQGGNGENKN